MIHTLKIPQWHPTRLNQLVNNHWAVAGRLKADDKAMVIAYANEQSIPRATCKRLVTLSLTMQKGQRAGDPDAYWKSLLDALVNACLLVNDSRKWAELAPVEFIRPRSRMPADAPPVWWGSVITLEDLD